MTATRVAGATSHETTDWHALDWHAISRTVRRLQARIVQAIHGGKAASGTGRWKGVSAVR